MNAGQIGLGSSRPESSRPGSTWPGHLDLVLLVLYGLLFSIIRIRKRGGGGGHNFYASTILFYGVPY